MNHSMRRLKPGNLSSICSTANRNRSHHGANAHRILAAIGKFQDVIKESVHVIP